jgi:cystathionine beta-lyase/cystathionine gamma-synthase
MDVPMAQDLRNRGAARARHRGSLVRFAIGIEEAADLIADLEQALAT